MSAGPIPPITLAAQADKESKRSPPDQMPSAPAVVAEPKPKPKP